MKSVHDFGWDKNNGSVMVANREILTIENCNDVFVHKGLHG